MTSLKARSIYNSCQYPLPIHYIVTSSVYKRAAHIQAKLNYKSWLGFFSHFPHQCTKEQHDLLILSSALSLSDCSRWQENKATFFHRLLCTLYLHFVLCICTLYLHFVFCICTFYLHFVFVILYFSLSDCSRWQENKDTFFHLCNLYLHFVFCICTLYFVFALCVCTLYFISLIVWLFSVTGE